jgi:hypothetical protein
VCAVTPRGCGSLGLAGGRFGDGGKSQVRRRADLISLVFDDTPSPWRVLGATFLGVHVMLAMLCLYHTALRESAIGCSGVESLLTNHVCSIKQLTLRRKFSTRLPTTLLLPPMSPAASTWNSKISHAHSRQLRAQPTQMEKGIRMPVLKKLLYADQQVSPYNPSET